MGAAGRRGRHRLGAVEPVDQTGIRLSLSVTADGTFENPDQEGQSLQLTTAPRMVILGPRRVSSQPIGAARTSHCSPGANPALLARLP
jgi:hypothetical protein